MKASKFKIVFIILLIATIIWGIVFYYVLQEYHKFVEGLGPLKRELWLWDPWWRWNGMPYILFAGFLLLLEWIGFIAIAIGKLLERKKEKIKEVKEISKEKLTEKFSMVFLVVAGTVAILLGSVNSMLWVTAGVSWIFWGLAYLKKAYTKHLAVTLLISGSILTIIGLNLAYATHQHLILAIGVGVLSGGICNLITYASWEREKMRKCVI